MKKKKKSVYRYPLTATYFLVYYNLIITLFLQFKEYLCNINNFVVAKQKCIDYIAKWSFFYIIYVILFGANINGVYLYKLCNIKTVQYKEACYIQNSVLYPKPCCIMKCFSQNSTRWNSEMDFRTFLCCLFPRAIVIDSNKYYHYK